MFLFFWWILNSDRSLQVEFMNAFLHHHPSSSSGLFTFRFLLITLHCFWAVESSIWINFVDTWSVLAHRLTHQSVLLIIEWEFFSSFYFTFTSLLQLNSQQPSSLQQPSLFSSKNVLTLFFSSSPFSHTTHKDHR